MDPFDSPLSSPGAPPSKPDITARFLHDKLMADGPEKLISFLTNPGDGRFPKPHLNALFELIVGQRFTMIKEYPITCRDNIPIIEVPNALLVLVALLSHCTEESQVESLASLKFLCGSLRNKDICCEAGVLGGLMVLLAKLCGFEHESSGIAATSLSPIATPRTPVAARDEESSETQSPGSSSQQNPEREPPVEPAAAPFQATLSLIQLLGRHHATPHDVKAFLSLIRSAYAAHNGPVMTQLLVVLKAMSKHTEPSKVFDFDGSPESGILIPQFKLGSNGYTISFWLHPEAVSTENAGREQRLFTLLNDNGDGLILSLMPQRRAAHTILCAALHSKNNVTTQVFEANPILHHRWIHIAIVHTPSRLFQRRSELKLYMNGKSAGAKSLAYLDTNRIFTKVCWGTDASMATELAPPGQSLRGQLTVLGLFNDALSDDKIHNLYATLPDQAKNIVPGLDQQLVCLYHPHIPPGDVVYDLAGVNHGVRFGSLRIIRSLSVRESLHCIGGIENFFPLFLKLDAFLPNNTPDASSPRTASTDSGSSPPPVDAAPIALNLPVPGGKKTSSTAPSPPPSPSSASVSLGRHSILRDGNIASDILETMANLIHNSKPIKDVLFRSHGISVLGLLFERIPVAFLDIHLLQALGSLVGALGTHDEDEELSNQGLKYLLWNPKIWTRPSFEIQQQHHKFLLAHIQTKRIYYRHYFGVHFLLELLRSYPLKPTPLSGVSSSLSSPHTAVFTPSSPYGSMSSLPAFDLSASLGIPEGLSPANTKAYLAGLPKADSPDEGIHKLSPTQVAELRLIILRMMEIETEYVLNHDEMFALLGSMTTSDCPSEVIDAAKFFLACLHQEPKHNFHALQGLGGFYVFLPMLESREESVRLLCIQLLRTVVNAMEEKERHNAISQIAVALSLALSSFPLTLSTYYALMALLLGSSVAVDWRCDFRLKSGPKGDLVARITGFPDLDGSQTFQYPEILHVIFELLTRPEKRGSAPVATQGWDLVVRVLQDFRLLLAQRPPDHVQNQTTPPRQSNPRRSSSATLPHFRNWAIIQAQPDWLDHLLNLVTQADDFIKHVGLIPPADDTIVVIPPPGESQPLAAALKASSSSSPPPSDELKTDDAVLARDMLSTMINNLLVFPMLELKDGWKVVQGAEVAVYRFAELNARIHAVPIPFDSLKFLKTMYRTLLRNLKIELDRLFSSRLGPQKYAHFWENVTHLTLLVEEFLFYQPRNKSKLVIVDGSSATDPEQAQKQNSQQLRAHMHRSIKKRFEMTLPRPVSPSVPQASSSGTISPPPPLFGRISSPGSQVLDENATAPSAQQPIESEDSVSSTATAGLSIQPQQHTILAAPKPLQHARSMAPAVGKWKDFTVAVALFELLDYVIPQTPFSMQLTSSTIEQYMESKMEGPTAGDMAIIDVWHRVDTTKEWGKEKHKILITVIRTLVTTLFDGELILQPGEHNSGEENERQILRRREIFFIQSILRIHRLLTLVHKHSKSTQSQSSQPLAGLAFAISSVSTLSSTAIAINHSEPSFSDVVLFCAGRLLKFMTQASEHPSEATTNIVNVAKEVLNRWIDLTYFENVMTAPCPEANPFTERKQVFDKRSLNDAVLTFASDLWRSPRHQLWRARINKAVTNVEQGAILSIRPMIGRKEMIAGNYNAALEKVKLDRTNDTPIYKATRQSNQKIANAYYETSSVQKQKSSSESESSLRRFYRLWHQLHETNSIWNSSLLDTPLTASGTRFVKLDKSEQRPRMRRKIKTNYLGTQHLKATHAYHKQQWAKESEARRASRTNVISPSPSPSSSMTSLPSPPISPSPSFVAQARDLPLSQPKDASAVTSPNPSSRGDNLISADTEIDLLMEEVDETEFKELEPRLEASPGSGTVSPVPGSMQSGQPLSHIHGQKVLYSSPCELILPEVKILGRIFVTEEKIIFQHDSDNSQVIQENDPSFPMSPRTSQLSASMVGIKDIGYFNWTRTLFKHKFGDRVWRLQDLTAIFCRRYMLSWTAIELAFENNGKNYFINLPKEENKKLFSVVEDLRPPKLRPNLFCTAPQYFKRMSETTERWRRREISNFEYLVYLNHAASRTVNDLTQYPVFPWVLKNYTSDHLDLNDPDNYRDLSKPIGALEPSRLEKFIERYENFVDDSIPRFYYGSHYSSAGAVLFYLLRLEPFTTQFICLQGGKFDYPDRLFSSIAESWENCLRSTTDVKELIPEFYYMPEFLMNQNKLDLGQKTHAPSPIDNVILPPWANGSPHEFVRIHRDALESDYVSANLHHWIDLIFGYKQLGKDAVAAYNTFFHVTYEGSIDLDALVSLEQKQAMLSQIENFGQTPAQLLTTPHPAREPSVREKMIQAFPERNGAPRPSLPQLMSRARQTTSRLPFSTAFSTFVLNRSLLLTINIYGEFLIHKWESKPNPASFMELHTDISCGFECDVNFSTNSSPVSFPKDSSQPIMRAALVDAFTQRYLPGNRRVPAQCLGVAPSQLVFEVYPDDTNYILSTGHWDGSVHVAMLDEFLSPNLPVLKIRQTLAAHPLPVTCMALSESLFLTGSMDNTAMLWNVTYERKQMKIDPRPVYAICGHSAPLSAVALSKALDIIVTASEDGLLMIHQLDLKRNRTRAVLRHQGAKVTRLVIASAGYIVCYSQGPRLLHCYSMNGTLLSEKSLFDGEDSGEGLSQLLVSKNSRLVLCAEGSTIVFRCAPTLDIIHILYADNKDSSIASLKLSEDERVLFVGYKDGSLTFVTLPDWNSGDVDL